MLEVRNVSKRYGAVSALRNVDLSVSAGRVVGLVGPNGAGKTTLLSIVAGLRRADSGTVHVGDRPAAGGHPCPDVGFAPQDVGVCPVVTVEQNLTLFAALSGVPRVERRRRVSETATALGLEPLLKRKAGILSGGQKRRLHVAMALVHRPRLLLLDEATTGADVETRQQLLTMVRSLADSGAAVLYCTHYLAEVEQIADEVAILSSGRVVAHDAVAGLMEKHGDAHVELRFDGVPPAMENAVVSGDRARIRTADPAGVAAKVLSQLSESDALTSLEVHRPGLESVYLSLTGETSSAGDGAPEPASAS